MAAQNEPAISFGAAQADKLAVTLQQDGDDAVDIILIISEATAIGVSADFSDEAVLVDQTKRGNGTAGGKGVLSSPSGTYGGTASRAFSSPSRRADHTATSPVTDNAGRSSQGSGFSRACVENKNESKQSSQHGFGQNRPVLHCFCWEIVDHGDEFLTLHRCFYVRFGAQ